MRRIALYAVALCGLLAVGICYIGGRDAPEPQGSSRGSVHGPEIDDAIVQREPTEESQPIRARLSARTRWTGKVVYEDGRPAVGVDVQVAGRATEPMHAVADAQGAFALSIEDTLPEFSIRIANDRGPTRTQTFRAGESSMTERSFGVLVLRDSTIRLSVTTAGSSAEAAANPWPCRLEVTIRSAGPEHGAQQPARVIGSRTCELSDWSQSPSTSLTLGLTGRIVVAWTLFAPGSIIAVPMYSETLSLLADGTFGESRIHVGERWFVIGELVDAAAQPVGGATLAISCNYPNGRAAGLHKIRTVADGRFVFPCGDGASGFVWVDNPRGKARRQGWRSGEFVRLPFDASDGIRLRVVDATGAPVERYAFLSRVTWANEQDRARLLQLLLRYCPGGCSLLKSTELKQDESWFVVLPDGSIHEHRVSGSVTGSYRIVLGDALPVGSLKVRIAPALARLGAPRIVPLGPEMVNVGPTRRVKLVTTDDPTHLVRESQLMADAANDLEFIDLAAGWYRCAFVVDNVVQWEQAVEVTAKESREVVLGVAR